MAWRRQTFSDQFENLEVLWTIVLLVCLLEFHLELDLSRYMILTTSSRLKFKPAVSQRFLFSYRWTQTDVAQECFLVGSVVNGNVDLRSLTKNITRHH